MKIRNVFTVIAISMSIGFLFNCGGTEPIYEGPDSTDQFSVESNNILPGQIIQIISSEVLLNDSYIASFGDTTINLTKESDSNLAFIVPVLPSGGYTMNISDNEINETLDFIISDYTPITDVQKVADDYISNAQTSIDILKDLQSEDWSIESENITLLENITAEFTAEFNKLSQNEKEQVTYFLKNNSLLEFNIPDIDFNDSLYRNSITTAELTRLKREFVLTMVSTALNIEAFVGLVLSPDPISKVFALGSAGFLVFQVIELRELAGRIGWLAAIPNTFSNEIESFIVNGTPDVVFNNEVPKRIISKIEYRSIKKGDENYSEGFIAELASQINKFSFYWKKMNDGLNTLKSKFGYNTPELKGSPNSLPANPRTKKYYPEPSGLSIENVSSAQVKLGYKVVENGLEVTVEADKEVEFTFDLVYKADGFEDVRITYDAKVSEPVFDFTGTWTLSYYTMDGDGKEYLHQQKRFTCNSSGYASSSEVRYPTNPSPNNSWKPAGSVSISYNNGQIVLNASLGWYVDVINFDDNTFYSPNWNTVYNKGDYYWKMKLER